MTNFSNFRDDERGSITAFILCMFLIMVVGGGMAVDFMRHESERVRFQDALDRGVLTAASFDQVDDSGIEYNPPRNVVSSFLTADGYDVDALNLTVTPGTNSLATRSIAAEGDYSINTFFLRIINIPTLTVAASSEAATRFDKLEISLVVDISGSMEEEIGCWRDKQKGCNYPTKLDDLKVAAHDFVDKLITTDSAPITSMSIVPFSGTVNPGAAIANELAKPGGSLNKWHDHSSCIEFEDADFDTAAIRTSTGPQYNLGQPWIYVNNDDGTKTANSDGTWNGFGYWWCPKENNQILPISNNLDALHGTIEGLSIEGYTSAWMGMKWGAALLDRSFEPAVQALALTNFPIVQTTKTLDRVITPADPDTGTEAIMGYSYEIADPYTVSDIRAIDVNHSNRPGLSRGDTKKFLVLMSDGRNTLHEQIDPSVFNVDSSASWRTSSNASHWADVQFMPEHEVTETVVTSNWVNNRRRVCNRWGCWMQDDWTEEITETEVTRTVPARHFYNTPKSSDAWNNGRWNPEYELDTDFTTRFSTADAQLKDICDAAKLADITVYTIGFDINAPGPHQGVPVNTVPSQSLVDGLGSDYTAYKGLFGCATSGSKFYHAATAAELYNAFNDIASNVSRLKLVN